MADNSSVHIGRSIMFSEYFDNLDGPTKARYKVKVEMCGFDPYKLKKSDFDDDVSLWPAIEYPDIVNYLVLQTSWVTKTQMKAYKSLDLYNFFVSGWVSAVLVKTVGPDKIVLFSRVNHSQRARETPLKAWVLAENDGSVITAHCNCMAGLSEACSHVGATLFAVEAGLRLRSSRTCTQEKSSWLMPAYVKEIPYKPVCKMDFSSAKAKHKHMTKDNVTPTALRMMPALKEKQTFKPKKEEIEQFFKLLSEGGTKPAVLSVIASYSDSYVPQVMDHLPKPLTSLFQQQHTTLNYAELLTTCENISVQLTADECSAIEKETKQQSLSRSWFEQRAGRITASKLKAACHTNPAKPSKSLIKAICYPEAHKFSTEATKWGCSHEKGARDTYERQMYLRHESFCVSDSGLLVNPLWPHLGASPDGMVSCDCCGNGVCEIKCPFCHKESCIEEAASKKSSCLVKADDRICLDHKHAYYYQAQINIGEVAYCDFVVWTEQDIHIERIFPDVEFWDEAVNKATHIFRFGVLPEIIGKWYTRPMLPTSLPQDNDKWCYCQEDLEDTELIGCDNDLCTIQWFHMNCLKLQNAPKGKWFCPTCRQMV